MTITWKGKIWETGTSTVITVPKAYVGNHMVKRDKEYKITIEEVVSDE